MNIALMIFVIIIGTCLTSTTSRNITEENKELEIDNLSKPDEDYSENLDVQKKRESGYSYNKPLRLPVNYRPSQSTRLSHRRRPHSKRPGHQNRPFNQYGLPKKHSKLVMQHSFIASPGIANQNVPISIKNSNFEEPNPIASQNNIPFGQNTALYLPPKNQRLPAYSDPSIFTFESSHNIVNDNSNSHQISDGALFLAQNAQAISELYGDPTPNQAYSLSNIDLFDENNKVQQQNDAENVGDSRSNDPAQVSQDFSGALPTYTSGILSSQETLQKIQSLEKDRLILELQRALLQSQNAESNRYPQNVNVYSQEHSTGIQFKPSETPKYTFTYGLSTIPTTPSSTVPVSSNPTPEVSNDGARPSLPPQPTGIPGFPSYSGYFPSIITGTNVLQNVPSYNPGFIGFGAQNVPIKPIDSATHFGIPLPSRPDQTPSALPDSSGVSHVTPVIPARPTAPTVISPIHPISTPLQPVPPVYPIATPLRPVVPANPVTPIQPVVTPIIAHQGHTFRIQPTNPLVYKQVKAVYPLYYPGQKAISPAQPWVYPQKPVWN